MFTTCPEICFFICGIILRHVEEAGAGHARDDGDGLLSCLPRRERRRKGLKTADRQSA